MDSCVYIKTNDLSGDKYCFGDGDINAQCQGEDVDTGFNPPANPPANPEETANEDRSFSYLTNDFPGANTAVEAFWGTSHLLVSRRGQDLLQS